LLDDAFLAIEELVISINKDNDNRDVELSVEEYKGIASKINYNDSILKTYNDTGDINVSLEDIVAGKQGLIGRIKKLILMLKSDITEGFNALYSLTKLLSEYKINKLKMYKEKISSGDMKPNKYIDLEEQKYFNKKMGVFYSFGGNLDKKTDSFIDFLKLPVDNIVKDKFYDNLLDSVLLKLVGMSDAGDMPKDKKSSEFFSNLKGVDFLVDPKSDRFKAGFLMKYFSDEVSMISLVTTKTGTLRMHSDILPTKNNITIKALDKKEVIKLIDFGIKEVDNIRKAQSYTKKEILPSIAKNIVGNITSSILGSFTLGTTSLIYGLTAGRFSSALIKHLLITNKELVRYDNIIIEYINLTYTK